ncbi:MAG: DEAD/DEAH box helicase, partial [Planctomycetota bacterium]
TDAMWEPTLVDDWNLPPRNFTRPQYAAAKSLGKKLSRNDPITLREDQIAARDAFEAAGGRGILVMPTGTGKTVVAIDLIRRHATATLVVVPVRDLMYQWHDVIRQRLGIDAGLIGDGVHRVSPVSVTTYDSAAIHMPRIGQQFDMLVFDEAHHLSGAWRSDAARMSVASIRLGLTATPPEDPERLASLHTLIGPTVFTRDIRTAAGETLADYRVQRVAVRMEAAEEKAYRGYSRTVADFVSKMRDDQPGFQWDHIYRLVADPTSPPDVFAAAQAALTAFRAKRKIEENASGKLRVLEDLFRLHCDRPVIVFTGSNRMARHISMRFLVPCLLSHCAKKERREVLAGFAAGEFPVLVANRVLDEGVDLPAVKTAIVLGGTASTRQATQRLGRVLRKTQSGQDAVLYEVVTEATNEVHRSRDRRRSEAYKAKPVRESEPTPSLFAEFDFEDDFEDDVDDGDP